MQSVPLASIPNIKTKKKKKKKNRLILIFPHGSNFMGKGTLENSGEILVGGDLWI
jgi:hypothetical protein